jgi:two-component system sensor histidine kinase RpfC
MRVNLFRTSDPPSLSRPLSILVAGDNPTDQNAIVKILERAAHRATVVDNGETMLDVLDTCEFDLVLMHVNMPATNGIETIKLYRFLSLDRPYVPIVAVVADATEEAKRRCQEAGMDACITMPIERHHLLEILQTLAQDTGKNAQAASNAGEAKAAHPGNRTASAAAIDPHALNALENLGGAEFVDELAAQFLDDLPDILRALTEATGSGDVLTFGEQLHSLRSASANIGARGIYEMCLAWGQITPENLAGRSETLLEGLREEFKRVRSVLECRLFECNIAARRTENVCDRPGMHVVHTA